MSVLAQCGKPSCCEDREGAGHGPYSYPYYTNEKTGRYTSRYEGKQLPPGSTAGRESAEDQEAEDRRWNP